MSVTPSHLFHEGTIVDSLAFHVDSSADATYLSAGDDLQLSYKDASQLVHQVVRPALLEKISQSNSSDSHRRVVVLAPNGPLLPLVHWALWSIRAAVCPISTTAEPHLWVSMLRALRPTAVVAAHSLLPRLRSALEDADYIDGTTLIALESLIPDTPIPCGIVEAFLACRKFLAAEGQDAVVDSEDVHPKPDDIAIILFTSSAVDSSTLKAVAHSHRMVLDIGVRVTKHYSQTRSLKRIRHCGWLPLGHIFELIVGLHGLVLQTGGEYVFYDAAIASPDVPAHTPIAELLLHGLKYYGNVDSLFTAPFVVEHIYKNRHRIDFAPLKSLAYLNVGGANTPQDVWKWCRSEEIPLENIFGATETGTICARDRGEEDGFSLMEGLMGVVEVEHPSDDAGELIIISENIPSSYLIGPTTAHSQVPGVGRVTAYRTGEIWRIGRKFVGKVVIRGQALPPLHELGRTSGIHYVSRADDRATFSSGIKVDVLALERLLDSQAEIQRAAVLSKTGADELLALVQPADPFREKTLDVVDAVLRTNKTVPYEKRIKKDNIILVDRLPVTGKGTVHRKAIRRTMQMNNDQWPPSETLPLVPSPNGPRITTPDHAFGEPHIVVSADLRRKLGALVAETLELNPDVLCIPGLRLSDLSVNSLAVARLANAIDKTFGCCIIHADFYAVDTFDQLCALVQRACSADTRVPSIRTPSAATDPLPTSATDDDLIISGISCRFPGDINTLDDLWSALLAPESHARRIARPAPPSRWKCDIPGADLPMAWLDDSVMDVQPFSGFFGILPTEAETIPPTIRIAMQMGYAAIEDAGIAPKSLDGQAWSVFTSMNDSGWKEKRISSESLEEYGKYEGNCADASAAGRLAYFLNLTGPAFEVKSACSSSAVAIHQACSAIRNGDCTAAVVIASTMFFSPSAAIFRGSAGIASPSGKCATFSADADGFLPSEGAVAVVIQRRQDLRAPGYARIRATAITQDGRSLGFSAPNPNAQRRLLESSLRRAGCTPEDIDYLEAHGTGTPVGDAIECSAIREVFCTRERSPLMLGSVKATIGHTEECAGLAGVFKAILCMKKGVIPPQPHITSFNPSLHLASFPVYVPRTPVGFPRGTNRRLVSISSFGLSGTLANVILEEVEQTYTAPATRPGLFLMSARTPNDYVKLAKQYVSFFQSDTAMQIDLASICHTSQVARDHFALRTAHIISNVQQLADELLDAIDRPPSRPTNSPSVAFWFSLPHPHIPQIAVDHPLFARHLSSCYEAGCTLALDSFARQLALARTLEDLGCQVHATGGEGIAEYCAAAFAGTIDDRTLFELLSQLQSHAVAVYIVPGPSQTVTEGLLRYRADEVRVVGLGADGSTLISTSEEAFVTGFVQSTTARRAHPLAAAKLLNNINLQPRTPRLAVLSCHLATVMDTDICGCPAYWTGLPDRVFDAQKARAVLEEQGAVIDLLDPALAAAHGTLERMLGKLFVRGAELRWQRYALEGSLAHIPTYIW